MCQGMIIFLKDKIFAMAVLFESLKGVFFNDEAILNKDCFTKNSRNVTRVKLLKGFNFLVGLVLVTCFAVKASDCFAAEKKWQHRKSAHFQIFYQNAPQDFLSTVEKEAERSLEEIIYNINAIPVSWRDDNRVKIYIYDDQEAYYKAGHANWSHGSASPKEKVIKTFPAAAGFFDSTLPHELGHIVFREIIGMTSIVPLWLEEGFAMYQEKAKRFGVNQVVLAAIKEEKIIELEQLTPQTLYQRKEEKIVDLFYAQSASVVYYLIKECGLYRFSNFCRLLKEGVPFQEALYRAYSRFKTLAELNRAWVEYLQND